MILSRQAIIPRSDNHTVFCFVYATHTQVITVFLWLYTYFYSLSSGLVCQCGRLVGGRVGRDKRFGRAATTAGRMGAWAGSRALVRSG